MQAKLTKRTIRALRAGDKPYEVVDMDLKGFLLRIQPSGVMTYYFSYRNDQGRRVRYRIGRQGSITPMQARDEAQQLSARVIAGEDVQATKKQARLEAARAKYRTLDGLLEYKYGPWVKAERKTGQETIDRIKTNFSHLLNRPMGEISDWDIQKWRVERQDLRGVLLHRQRPDDPVPRGRAEVRVRSVDPVRLLRKDPVHDGRRRRCDAR